MSKLDTGLNIARWHIDSAIIAYWRMGNNNYVIMSLLNDYLFYIDINYEYVQNVVEKYKSKELTLSTINKEMKL